jgi:lipopolysaccharide transport system permease protein
MTNTVNIVKQRKVGDVLSLKELYHYKELLYFLVWRDTKVRYKQTAVGVAWVVLQPIISMLIYTVLFSIFIKVPSEGVPYPLFVFIGLVPWTFFANSVLETNNSLVRNSQLITKVYFPRIIIPLSQIIVLFIDLIFALFILGFLIVFYDISITWSILFLPILILLTIAVALGISLLFSSLNVRYRDFQFIVPFIVQIWMFCSPVIYPFKIIPVKYQSIVALNPLVGIIEGYRAILLQKPMNWDLLFFSSVIITILLVIGLYLFASIERKVADFI